MRDIEAIWWDHVLTCDAGGLQVIPVKMDGEGLLPSGTGGLEDVLGSWDPANGKRPHLLYTVTYVDLRTLGKNLLTHS